MVRRRAFIVAVEHYADMQGGLTATLPGTHDAAVAFRRWLIDQQNLAPADIYFCAENASVPGRTAGATRDEIVRELFRLKDEGKDSTDELYVLYVGHGLCYRNVDGVRLADILLAADYERPEISGNSCLKIDEVQMWLRLCMGPSDHYYFIDACRNEVNERDIKVGSLGLTYDNSNLGTPTVYTLYSALEGTVAAVNSGFVLTLVEALSGIGRAKVWYKGGMAVLFGSVKDYVARKLVGQNVDPRVDGGRDGVIRVIAPTPGYDCTVDVANALPTDAFVLTVSDSRQTVVQTIPFTGPAVSFSRVPDDYMLSIEATAATIEALDPLPADLYDDRTVHFVKRTPAAGGAPAAPARSDGALDVSLIAPNALRVELRNLSTGVTKIGNGTFREKLAPGNYSMKMSDVSRGVTFRRETVEIGGDSPVRLDLGQREVGGLHDRWLAHFPPQSLADGFDFSESLGPTADQGMDLWLALFGGSRIIAPSGDFSKLASLPLATFGDAGPDRSEFYFLSAIEPTPDRVSISFSVGDEIEMHTIPQHPELPGVFEYRASGGAGYAFVSLRIDENAPISVAFCALPNCATMLTLSLDDAGIQQIQQFVLPIHHLAARVPTGMQNAFADQPLRRVRQIVEVQRRFSQSRALTPVLSDEQLDDLIGLKWFEPITALLACYDLARRGKLERLRQVEPILRVALAGAPDVEAIAKMAGLDWKMPRFPPLVLDGLLSLNMPRELVRLEPERLDFRKSWTTWAGAVGVKEIHGTEAGIALA